MLLQKRMNCNDLKALGGALLAALEEDAEALEHCGRIGNPR
jgi:hypothetical protein